MLTTFDLGLFRNHKNYIITVVGYNDLGNLTKSIYILPEFKIAKIKKV